MDLCGVRIVSTGAYHPTTRNSTADRPSGQDIERQLGDLFDQGYGSYLAIGETAVGMGVAAARNALANATIDPLDIDVVLSHALFADYAVPTDTCAIADAIGTQKAAAYFVDSQCASFLSMTNLAAALIRAHQARNILVINVAHWATRALPEGQDPGPMGDGAAAVLLSAAEREHFHSHIEERSGEHFNTMVALSSYATGKREYMGASPLPSFNEYIYIDPPKVIMAAIEKAGFTRSDINWILPHQPTRGIMYKWAQDAGFPAESVLHSFPLYGNLGGTTLPMNLHHFSQVEPRIRRGDRILFFSTGAGFHLKASVWTY